MFLASHYILTAWYTMITFDDIMRYYDHTEDTKDPMITLSGHYDHTTRRLGSHSEDMMRTLWSHYEDIMRRLRSHYQDTVIDYEDIMRTLWRHHDADESAWIRDLWWTGREWRLIRESDYDNEDTLIIPWGKYDHTKIISWGHYDHTIRKLW